MCEPGNNTDATGCEEKLSSLAGSVCSVKVTFFSLSKTVTTVTNHTKPRGFFPLQVGMGAGPTEAGEPCTQAASPQHSASSLHLVRSRSGRLLGAAVGGQTEEEEVVLAQTSRERI